MNRPVARPPATDPPERPATRAERQAIPLAPPAPTGPADLAALAALAGPAGPAGPPPYLAVDTACDGCSGGLVLTGEDAVRVRQTAAHRALMSGGLAPTPAERAERAALLARAATAAGWVRTPAGRWRCQRCRQRYGETGSPRRFTVREVIARHRRQARGTPGKRLGESAAGS